MNRRGIEQEIPLTPGGGRRGMKRRALKSAGKVPSDRRGKRPFLSRHKGRAKKRRRQQALFCPSMGAHAQALPGLSQLPAGAPVETRRRRYAPFGSDRRPISVHLMADGIQGRVWHGIFSKSITLCPLRLCGRLSLSPV